MSSRSVDVAITGFSGVDRLITLNGIPDACPECHKGQAFENPFYVREGLHGVIAHAYFQCRFTECLTPFFVDYFKLSDRTFEFQGMFVPRYLSFSEDIPEIISDISPEYVKIFSQAQKAEANNLDLIAGCGYRKALEFLIKDYCIKLTLDGDKETKTTTEKQKTISEIKKAPLHKVISDYLQMPKVKSLSTRATWLGNDETHYERRIENGDISAMKSLMKLTIHYIEADEESKKLELAIQPVKKQ